MNEYLPDYQTFGWDPAKAEINLRKHGIAFEDAVQIFKDPLVITRQDRIENGEERWQSIGMMNNYCVVLVAHTVTLLLSEGRYVEQIRIISARRADPKERGFYERGYF